jgi:hypothetical protein
MPVATVTYQKIKKGYKMNIEECNLTLGNNLAIKSCLTTDDVMELCESVDVIMELTFLIREDLDKIIEKDNPNRVGIDYMIEQIYDLAFVASMHTFELMHPST